MVGDRQIFSTLLTGYIYSAANMLRIPLQQAVLASPCILYGKELEMFSMNHVGLCILPGCTVYSAALKYV